MADIKSEFLLVAHRVLSDCHTPLSAKKITDYAIEKGMFSDNIAGKTPDQTMKSKLSQHIRNFKDKSIFVRTKPGIFYLRNLLSQSSDEFNAIPLAPPILHERVLTFTNKWFDHSKNRFQGIEKKWNVFHKALFSSRSIKYLERKKAEQDATVKQIVTYIIVRSGGNILSFKRGNYTNIAQYLRGSFCIGFGGHVTDEDHDLYDDDGLGIRNCAIRELNEELTLPDEDKISLSKGKNLRIIGVLNDDSSPTGVKHFAYILEYTIVAVENWQSPKRGEKSITQLHWIKIDSTFPISDYEYWSQLCLRSFFREAVSLLPSYKIQKHRPKFSIAPFITCVVGEIGSGKTEVTKTLKDECGFIEINTGRLIAELLGIPPVPETPRIEFQKHAMKFIKNTENQQKFVEEIRKRTLSLSSQFVVIDGIRQLEILVMLQEILKPHLIIFYVQTSFDIAYNFFSNRIETPTTVHDYLKIISAEVENEIKEMIAIADVVFYNWDGLFDFKEAIKELVDLYFQGKYE